MYDVAVVGAGPSGAAAARACAEAGLSVLCIEEHAAPGFPVQCAGLLSCRAFAGCEVSDRSVLNTVQGARVVSDRGAEVFFDAQETKAYVVDRALLDQEMAGDAACAGAEIWPKTAVVGREGGRLITRGASGRRDVEARMVIAADGPRSGMARMLGLARAPVYLSGIQADLPLDLDTRYVEVHPNAAPQFFAWVIPTGEGRARVGLCGTGGVREAFERFAARYPAGCTHLVTGTIPLGTMPRTYGQRTLFVGDAAGMAKPTSGGGVYTGVRAARHAAAVAVSCCEADDFSDRVLAAYERRWQADFGRELTLGMRLFRLRQELSAENIDSLLSTLADPDITDLIVKYGDMDRPGRLIRHLMTKPKVLRNIVTVAGPSVRVILKDLNFGVNK
ncbi:NAD(P)/FAD-dependent oxidoreductase [Methanofollis formosanus]|uniref:NAD(P)/FAD-dependent oxidoreductase n=1 Tax=Methanofollis formosanus TaxID=299308 RepID=A0A8G1A197_9EURY|nr:NAD(P)/FAD-dependent oxidoreductase [Methanofollis formosanus]QYZ78581.1 NAD(P)/FAD-dependent oxidoreductase [Methanofollis formosanus]